MAEYRDEALDALVHSEEFQKADAGKKQKVLLAYGQATPAERNEFIYGSDNMEGLTLPTAFQIRMPNVGQVHEYIARQPGRGIQNPTREEQSLESQKGLLEAGLSMALPWAGSYPGQALKATRPLLGSAVSAIGEGVGNVAANRAVNAVEGQPLEWNTMDTAALLGPPAVRGTLGALKAGTRPAQRAYQRAEEQTTADVLGHQQKVNEAMVGRAEDMAAAEATAATENTARNTAYSKELTNRAAYNTEEAAKVGQANSKAQSAWRQERQDILTQFREDVADIHRRTDLSNQEKDTRIAQRTEARNQRIAEHNQAAATTSTNAVSGIDTVDYRAAYKESNLAAEKAPAVDVTPLNKAAKAAGLDLESPVDPYNPMSGVVSRLQKWGAGKAATEAPGQILTAEGKPITVQTPGTASTVPLGDLIDVHQELGRVINKVSGKQYKTAVEMYDTVGQMLKEQTVNHPDAATAVEKHFEGQRLWSRAKTIEEIQAAVDTNTTNPAPGEFRVKTPQIRDRINQLSNPKTNKFADSVTPEEWAQVHAEIDKLPTEPVGRPVQAKPDKTPNYTEAETRLVRDMGKTATPPEPTVPAYKTPPVLPETATPDYSNVRPPYSGSMPEPTKPGLGPFPISHAIFGKMAGAEVANVTYPFAGANSAWIRGGGAVLGTAPHWISQALMSLPHGRQMAANILAGKQTLRPQDLAALTSAARLVGGRPPEEESK